MKRTALPVSFFLAFFFASLFNHGATAQTHAEGPLTIVIPFAPGGASDIVVRALSDPLGKALARSIVVDNRGGGGGLIAAQAVARSGADAHMLLYGNQGQVVLSPSLVADNKFDPRADLTPLTLTARSSFLLVVPASSSVNNVRELVAQGRREKLRLGIPGIGAAPHMAAALLVEVTGVPVEYVAYRGSAPLMVDLLAGRLDGAFDNVATALPHVRGARLRALGISSAQRSPVAPDIATLAEAGLDGYAFSAWQGMFGPPGMSAEATAQLVDRLQTVLASPPVRDKLLEAGIEPATSSPAELKTLVARESDAWAAKVKSGLLRAQ
jgi:tripartite-type tricarboxylate transporter receptor subunit TctC